MKRIALETFYGDPMKEASGRPPPLSEASQYTTSYIVVRSKVTSRILVFLESFFACFLHIFKLPETF